MAKVADIQSIMEYLPHRYPFLLIDRVLEIMPGEKVVALKNVSMNEPFFQGHFPGNPIMPGVLIVEAMAQAGAVLCSSQLEGKHGNLFYFMGIDKVKFRKIVVPGDQMILKVKIIRQRSKTVKLAGTASVNQKIVAEAEILATIGGKS